MAKRKKPAEESDILTEAKRRWKLARDHQSAWRNEAREYFGFYAGDQWKEEDKLVLEEQGRPVIVFNRSAVYVDGITGYEINNRQKIHYYPRELGDARANEILTSAAEWVYDNCDGQGEESDAFKDATICGMGWIEHRLDDSENPEYDIRIEKTDPLEMAWDPNAKKPNLTDARYLFRAKKVSLAEAKEMFPDIDFDAIGTDPWNTRENDDNPQEIDTRNRYRGDAFSPTRDGEITIIEYQFKEKRKAQRVINPMTGQMEILAQDKFNELSKRMEGMGQPLQSAPHTETVCQRAFFVGDQTVSGPEDCPDPHSFTYKCITGKRNAKSNTWYGIMAALKDPQQWSNKWLSQILHIINSNAKGGLIAEKGAFEDQNQAEESWARADKITWASDGALAANRILPKTPPALPSGLDRLLEYANNSFGETSGINAEMLGMVDRQQAGVLEHQRKQAAVTQLAGLFDSLRRYRKFQGKSLLYLIQNYISDGRLIRIVGDDQKQYVPLTQDKTLGEYDVIVDQSASSPNVKEQTWGILQTLMPQLAKTPLMSPEVILEFMKYSPLPESLTSKLQEMAKQAAQQPPPPDPKVEQARAMLELKSQEMQGKMQMAQQESEQEMALKQKEFELDASLKMATAQQDAQLEMAKADHKMQTDQAMAQNKMQIGAMAGVAKAAQPPKGKSGPGQPAPKPANITINAPQQSQPAQQPPKQDDGLAQAIVSGIGAVLHQNAQAMGAIVSQLRGIGEQMTAPKRLVRDEDGKAIGVETVMN